LRRRLNQIRLIEASFLQFPACRQLDHAYVTTDYDTESGTKIAARIASLAFIPRILLVSIMTLPAAAAVEKMRTT
jgi:hypothetical protein